MIFNPVIVAVASTTLCWVIILFILLNDKWIKFMLLICDEGSSLFATIEHFYQLYITNYN